MIRSGCCSKAIKASQNANLSRNSGSTTKQSISHHLLTTTPLYYVRCPKQLYSPNSTECMRHQTLQGSAMKFFRNTHNLQSSSFTSSDQNNSNQTRKANFGSMVTYIKEDLTPNILTQLPDSSTLDPSITLKLNESLVNLDIITNHFPDALNISGRVSYQTIMKTIQLFLNGFYLHDGHDHKLLVTHSEVDPDGIASNQYGIIKGAPKIIIHWKLIHKPILSDIKSNEGSGKDREINIPDLNEFEEKFSGIFCFELNDDCDKILVHNVENILILGDRDRDQGVRSGEGFDGFIRA